MRDQIKEEIEEDIQVHLRKKEMIVNRNVQNLQKRRAQEQRKVEAIRVELERRHDE